MSKGGYPSVFVVDTHATLPPVPPRLSQRRQQVGAVQTVLILLVSVALCGMVIEACFIYRLHHTESAASSSFSKQIAGQDVPLTTESPRRFLLPSKPVAHLTGVQTVEHGNQIMAWSMVAGPLLHEMYYKNRSLVIQKEGYYYVYSKVFFLDSNVFHHSVHRNTQLYAGKSIPLLMARKYSDGCSRTPPRRRDWPCQARSNSFLGGVFHLVKGDAIFVKVSNTSKILQHDSLENVFGAFMI
ncbi:tumor necrosis factor ligand superfamily member 14 [Centropristis striata]|uniref:tumor necrosis factor ligand superfamily member 14 n=1 Tax=Centropristis striata TaxID=184440 RepID=UPI0027DF401F|nr:tumor necrosis factor ligand superfamily member 14 [Centropristis striata]XP_059204589.1 tumor necrosis factor ligand superfamily member 14 [Centropristis striata]